MNASQNAEQFHAQLAQYVPVFTGLLARVVGHCRIDAGGDVDGAGATRHAALSGCA